MLDYLLQGCYDVPPQYDQYFLKSSFTLTLAYGIFLPFLPTHVYWFICVCVLTQICLHTLTQLFPCERKTLKHKSWIPVFGRILGVFLTCTDAWSHFTSRLLLFIFNNKKILAISRFGWMLLEFLTIFLITLSSKKNNLLV